MNHKYFIIKRTKLEILLKKLQNDI